MKLTYRFNKPRYLYEVKERGSNKIGAFFTLRSEARELKNQLKAKKTQNKPSTKYVIYRHDISLTREIIR